MTIKLESKTSKGAGEALDPYRPALYATLGKRLVVIAELEAVERNEVADDDEKSTWVKLRIVSLEVAGAEQEDAVRKAMNALNIQRTAFGTLTEDQDVELSQTVLDRCAGDLALTEAARLHAAIEAFGDKLLSTARNSKLNAGDIRRSVTDLSRGLLATIYPNMLPPADA